ncbi:MAG: tetratricopeptide repeat protein [Candidatus Omnitrophica bacterium]|nr:tetratricopeptide repeat protein [Candidatus Omnitrophota bacterium]
MKRIFLAILMFFLVFSLASCAKRYDMKEVKKVSFIKPERWKEISGPEYCQYDHVFRIEEQKNWLEIYLTVRYLPGQNALRWLKEDKKRLEKRGHKARKIVTFSGENLDWFLLETETRNNNLQFNTRKYAAGEKRSPRIIECYMAGTNEGFLPLEENELNQFLNSIELQKIKMPDLGKVSKYNKNYFTSAEEMEFLFQAKEYFHAGKYEQAVTIFDALLERDATSKLKADVNCFLSECFLELGILEYLKNEGTGGFQNAIKYANTALKAQNHYWLAYLELGKAYLNMREYEVAQGYLKKSLKYCAKDNPKYQQVQFHYESGKNPKHQKALAVPFIAYKYKIEGILYDRQSPIVVISGSQYKTGDKVAGHVIMKIEPDKIYTRFDHRLDEFAIQDVIPQLQKPDKSKKAFKRR